MEEYFTDHETVVELLSEEMSALRIIVNELNPEELPMVNRHGLALFKKDHLWQYETYLEGLFNLHVRNPDNDQVAMGKFVKSLRV